MIVRLRITIVKVLSVENFDRHVIDVVSKLFSTRVLSAFPSCDCLGISSTWMCGADFWPVSKSET